MLMMLAHSVEGLLTVLTYARREWPLKAVAADAHDARHPVDSVTSC